MGHKVTDKWFTLRQETLKILEHTIFQCMKRIKEEI